MAREYSIDAPDVERASTWKWKEDICKQDPLDGAVAAQPRDERKIITLEEYPHPVSSTPTGRETPTRVELGHMTPTRVELGHMIHVSDEGEEWGIKLFRRIYHEEGEFITRDKIHEENASSREDAEKRVTTLTERINECSLEASEPYC